MKVTLIGAAGGIGQSLSLLLKINLPVGCELCLYDLNPSTPGIALDLSHIPNKVKVTGYSGSDSLISALENSDIVIITAGIARKPGMERSDLFNANANLIRNLMSSAAHSCPNACFCLITNPLNSLVPLAATVLKQAGVYNPRKLFGVTSLDIIRAESILSQYLQRDIMPGEIQVIGGHSGQTIQPLISRVSGHDLDESEIRSLTQQIQDCGTTVVKAKAGYGSATLAMASAGMRFISSLIRGLKGEENIVECAYVEGGSPYSKFFSQPLRLGKHGWSEAIDPAPFDAQQQRALDAMLPSLREEIALGEKFCG